MEKENRMITVVQTAGILLVVIAHCFYGNQAHPYKIWAGSFLMPLFVFASGYLTYYNLARKHLYHQPSTYLQVCQTLWKKFKRLMVPYLIIPSLVFLPKVMLSQFASRPVEASWHDYFHMMLYPYENVMGLYWFLPTLFLVFVIIEHVLYFTRKWTSRTPNQDLALSIICCIVALVLHLFNPLAKVSFMNMSTVIWFLFFFALGFYSCKYKIDALFSHYSGFIFVGTLLLSTAFVFWPRTPVLQCLSGLNGIILSLSFAYFYIQKDLHFLHPFFGSSYTLYLLSWFPQVFCQQGLMGLFGISWQLGGLLAGITGILIPYGCHLLLQKYKKTPVGKLASFVLGQ